MGNVTRPNRPFIFAALVSILFISLFASRVFWLEKKEPETHGETGTVVIVYDGDTIKVRFDNGYERKVRLIGIDCPEIDDPDREKSLQAQLAKRFVFHYLYRKTVKLTYEPEREDKYGRLLAYVWIGGSLFNEFILREGFAQVFLAFPYEQKERFIQAQKTAQEDRRGFWRKKPYPVTSTQNIRDHIGKLIQVRFTCVRTRHRGRFHFLYPEKKKFAVLIPEENRSGFLDLKTYKGRAIEAFGFLEEYRGQPQIMVFDPLQLKLAEDHLDNRKSGG
jgi:micrococcal nuclease